MFFKDVSIDADTCGIAIVVLQPVYDLIKGLRVGAIL